MKKYGLFGGTFDPIHNGHVSMALYLAESLGLDSVVLMPTFVPPHKIRQQLASAEHRLAMCSLVAQEHHVLQVSDLELNRGGASFTVDTLEALTEQYPDVEWHLITGADMFVTLRTWHRFEDIARMAVLCTIPRAGTDTTLLNQYADQLQKDGCRCYVADQPVEAVSSTEVRNCIIAGDDLIAQLPKCVADYISKHGLYRQSGEEMRTMDEQYIEIIRSRLSPYRFNHSMCVAQEAARLAERYGADPQKAYTAGILHDILKDTDPKSQLQILDDFAILLNNVERASPTLWHARSGEAFLRHVLGVTDEEILQAVRYHTTGRSGMSLLEQVLFTADFTSADRDYPDVETMRTLANQSLTAAMRYGVEYTIRDLINHGRAVHPDTLALYNDIVLSEKNGGQANETK